MTDSEAIALLPELRIRAWRFARMHPVFRRDREDLQQEGYVALLQSKSPEPQLAFAYRRMIDYVRRERPKRQFPVQLWDGFAAPDTYRALDNRIDAVALLRRGFDGLVTDGCRHKTVARGSKRWKCNRCGRWFSQYPGILRGESLKPQAEQQAEHHRAE